MPSKKILIADDSATVVDILKHILEDQFQIITAKDGIEAIEKVYQENPDLVILDILMPKMNGYQVCRLLKADPPTAELPVLILSIKDQKMDRYWGMVAGPLKHSRLFINITGSTLFC